MLKLENYKKCIFCKSNSFKVFETQKFIHNFYTLAIKSDFLLSNNIFKKMKVKECQRCFLIQNDPWFSLDDSFKIFNNIYGQHNRNWNNIYNYFNFGKKPDHGKLFKILSNNLKIKTYAEFNSPFMGLMIDFFHDETKNNFLLKKNFYKNTIKYLSSRQIVGLSKKFRDKKQKEASKYSKIIKILKKKIFLKNNTQKYLITDNSKLGWLYNDNYKSVNSRVFANELFDIKISSIEEKKKYNFDLFGIFHTLDHTFQPKKILDFAINNSKYVIVYCHINKNLEKQHLFSFTKKFLNYLKEKNDLKILDLTKIINKNYKTPEMYFLLSKKKFSIKKFCS